MKPLTFSILRLLSSADFRSGEELAASLGVSRATVSNALRDIDQLGIGIFRVRGRGYRLQEPIEWLCPPTIREALGDRHELFMIEVADVIESTNTDLMARALDPLAHGRCLVAEVQTAGRGRRGRQWESTVGGSLTFSLVWRFNQGMAQLSGLSLAIGIAVVRALREVGLAEVALKWPNDVMHHYRKLGGILIELQGDMLGPTAAVIGVGLNLRLGDEARGRVDQAVTDLASVLPDTPSRNRLLASLLKNLAEVLGVFERSGFSALREEWVEAHAYQDRFVELTLPNGPRERGFVRGVAIDGSLLLETTTGMAAFGTGDLSLRPVEPAKQHFVAHGNLTRGD